MDTTPVLYVPLRATPRQAATLHLKVRQDGECLIWVGAKTRKDWRGYAVYDIEGKTTVLHRQLWKDHRGPLTADQQLDHLCRNRACINLDHLEVVTLHENNVIRGEGPAALNNRKTHCPQLHEYSPENTYIDGRGRRHCRECGRARHRTYMKKRRAA